MTDSTAQVLQRALTSEAEARVEADKQKVACLGRVSETLPGKLEERAKAVVQEQRDVSLRLETEGIKQLRAELKDAATALAGELREAADEIKWPTYQGRFSTVNTEKIHDALSKYLNGSRTNALAAVFKKHGYSIRDDNAQGAQLLIYSRSLYDEEDLQPLANALNVLHEAELQVKNARAADESATIADMWED